MEQSDLIADGIRHFRKRILIKVVFLDFCRIASAFVVSREDRTQTMESSRLQSHNSDIIYGNQSYYNYFVSTKVVRAQSSAGW